MAGATLQQNVTDEQLKRFADLIYERTGNLVSPQKKTLLSNRLRRRLRSTGIAGYDEYLAHLNTLGPRDPEWDAFLQEITTHETYLFRDQAQWDWVSREYLPEIQSAVRRGTRPKSLRIWSAACSSGDEAYTMATCIAAGINDRSQWKIEIVGTDIGIGAVEKARNAKFSARAMRHVSDSLKRRFFQKTSNEEEEWAPKPPLSDWTSFRQHNLLDPMQAAPFDLIFVKNVLIYFDADSKRRVMANVDRVLRPGGHLVTGMAEGVSELVKHLESLRTWLHHKSEAKK